MSGRVAMLITVAALASAVGCGGPSASPGTTDALGAGSGAVPASSDPSLPTVDVVAARRYVSQHETLDVLRFEKNGSRTVKDFVVGLRTSVWAVPVAAGQTLSVVFQPADPDLSMTVLEVATGAVVDLRSNSGIRPNRDTVYLVRPALPAARAARNEQAGYTLTVSRA